LIYRNDKKLSKFITNRGFSLHDTFTNIGKARIVYNKFIKAKIFKSGTKDNYNTHSTYDLFVRNKLNFATSDEFFKMAEIFNQLDSKRFLEDRDIFANASSVLFWKKHIEDKYL
jgi:hypothetical protein